MAGSDRRPLFQRATPAQPGSVADLHSDLLVLDDLISSAPVDYPGINQLRRRRAEVATLVWGPVPELDLHLNGAGVEGHSTGGRSLGRFLTSLVDATKEVSKSLHGLKRLTTDLQVQPGPGSVRIVVSPPVRDVSDAAMARERGESVEVSGLRKLVSLFAVASMDDDVTAEDLSASMTDLHGKARRAIERLAGSTLKSEYEISGSWQDPRHGRATVSLSLPAAARLRAAASVSTLETDTARFQGEVDGWEWSSSTVKFAPTGARRFRATVPDSLATIVAQIIALKGQRAEAEFTVVTRYASDSGEVASRGYALTSIRLLEVQDQITGLDASNR